MVVAIGSCGRKESVVSNEPNATTLAAFDVSVLRGFETNTLEAFLGNPLREQQKVRYALALCGFWLVKGDLKTAKAYNTFAVEKAKKHSMKNEEAQGVMGSAMLAEASKDMPAAEERIAKAVMLFKEAGSKEVIYDAMFYKAELQHKIGKNAESLKTYTEILSLVEGPRAESIKRACQLKIAGLKAEDGTARPSGAANGSQPIR